MKKPIKPPKDFERLFPEMTANELAAHYGKSPQFVQYWARQLNLQKRHNRDLRKIFEYLEVHPDASKEELRELFGTGYYISAAKAVMGTLRPKVQAKWDRYIQEIERYPSAPSKWIANRLGVNTTLVQVLKRAMGIRKAYNSERARRELAIKLVHEGESIARAHRGLIAVTVYIPRTAEPRIRELEKQIQQEWINEAEDVQ